MPLKRKRGHKEQSPPETKQRRTRAHRRASPTRRATRQTPVLPPLIPGSASSSSIVGVGATTVPIPVTPVPLRTGLGTTQTSKHRTDRAQSTHETRLPATEVVPPLLPTTISPSTTARARNMSGGVGKENIRPSDLVAPEIPYHVSQPQRFASQASSLKRPRGPANLTPRSDNMLPSVVTPVLPPKPPPLPVSERPPLSSDRNIDKVVLGNLCFRTWYPSYYGKEVLGDTSGNARGGSKEGPSDAQNKAHPKKDRDGQPMLERLYVCPSCFKYARELVAWWGHVKSCDQRGKVPGRKMYSHPRGRRKILVPHDGRGPGPKKRRGDGSIRYVEQVVQDEGEWSIWEVDGEVDGLFCQNLSLFAKLFLDNKSVFFDVTGFNYFLLVYTPPESSDLGATPPIPQVTGFFSKEKMSWDNNNLACILVFPPWQRKGLGALLMGVSYEISRREGVLGGPEKPISDLGKKGYKRFWCGEISRWLLELDISQSTAGQEVIIDVDDCSRGTWISPEDCLGVLRDMGLVEDAGVGPGKPLKLESQKSTEAAEEDANEESWKDELNNDGADGDEKRTKSKKKKSELVFANSTTAHPTAPPVPAPVAQEDALIKEVPRVRVDKEAVRRYVGMHRINLEKTCDPVGFVEGYAIKAERAATDGGSNYGEER